MVSTAVVIGGAGAASSWARGYRGDLARLRLPGGGQAHIGRHPLPMRDLTRWYSRPVAGQLRPNPLWHAGYQAVGKKTLHYPLANWRTGLSAIALTGGAYVTYELIEVQNNAFYKADK